MLAKPRELKIGDVVDCVGVSTMPLDLHWYAVRCAGAPDVKVTECLQRIGIEVYVPKCLELRVVPKRELTPKQRISAIPIKRPTPVPLFPRYPFVRCDLRDERRHTVFRHLNVQGILCDGASSTFVPALLPDAVIEALKQREQAGALPRGTSVKQLAFAIGEKVRISGGPFIDFAALVDALPDVPIEKLDESARIKVLVAILGGEVVVEMSIADIEKL